MGIAMTLQQYLDDKQVAYEVTRHRRTGCSSKTAQASHVPGDNLAKGVVLKWDDTYILAVVPATRHVEIDRIAVFVADNNDFIDGLLVVCRNVLLRVRRRRKNRDNGRKRCNCLDAGRGCHLRDRQRDTPR